MGIWFALRDYVKNLSSENSRINRQVNELLVSLSSLSSHNKDRIKRINYEIESVRSLINSEQNRFFGGNKKYLLELQNKLSELNQEISKIEAEEQGRSTNASNERSCLTSELQDNLTRLSVALEKSQKLFDELDKKLPVVYLNGEKTTFKFIAELLDEGE